MARQQNVLTLREEFVLALVVTQDEGRTSQDSIVRVVLAHPGPFAGLSERYLRGAGISRVVGSLVDQGYLKIDGEKVAVTKPLEQVIKVLHPPQLTELSRALVRYYQYGAVTVDITETRERFERFPDVYPEDLVQEILETLVLYQKTQMYDMAIAKSWRCIEILLFAINSGFKLTKEKRATDLLRRFNEKQIRKRVPTKKGTRDAFEAFVEASSAVYSFRSKMAAHWARNWWWGKREIAAAVLVLTLHLANLYIIRIWPRIVVVPAHERNRPRARANSPTSNDA